MQYAKGFILTLVILVISVGCSRQNKNTDTEVIVPSVQVVSPVRADVENYYVATGELEALKSVEVSSEITGRIAKLNTDEGKRVTQGMVVAEMDDSTQKAEYAQALASLERMKAEWTKIQTGARPQELATAEQALLEAQSNYSLVSTDYIRIKNLYEQGVSSRQELGTTA